MALDPSQLTASILAVFKSKPKSAALAARRLAAAYQAYTLTAQAGVALPLFTTLESEGLEQALLPAMNAQTGTAATMASAWSSGVSAYWLTSPAPVIFSDGVNAGAVPVVPGAPTLIPILTAIFSNPRNTEVSAAQGIAQALDSATRTITIFLLPSAVTVPVL